MKKKVLCVFYLILYLLISCTLLSAKIEEEMTTLVHSIKTISSKQTKRNMSIDINSLFYDNTGNHLYEVSEGTGWENGLRFHEVYGYNIDYSCDAVTLYGTRNYFFVLSATRQPREGELAREVESFESVNDVYLLYYKQGIPENSVFPENAKLINKNNNVILLDMSDVTSPFFEHTAKKMNETMEMASKIFSLAEAESFLKELPKIASVAVVLVFGLVMWIIICCLTLKKCKVKEIYPINIFFMFSALCILQINLSKIDLPASMLPPENILQIDYYIDEYDMITETLQQIESGTSIQETMATIQGQCIHIFIKGVIITVVFVCAEIIYIWFRYWYNRKNAKTIVN